MQRKHFDVLVSTGGLILAGVLVVFGVYFHERYDFAKDNVSEQLIAQKIFFKPKDKLSPAELKQPGVVQYAGQQVDDGRKAEVYANQFIALHLRELADGKTFSELSAESRANPDDKELAAQVQTSFRGETLRGLLLSTYGFWKFGDEARLAMWVSFAAGAALFLLAAIGFVHALRTRPQETI